MRRGLGIGLGVLASLCWAAGGASDGGLQLKMDTSSWAKQISALLRGNQGPGDSPEEVRRKMVELRGQAATPEEGALIDRMISLIDRMAGDAGDSDLDAILADFLQLVRDASRLTPEDDSAQVEWLRQFVQLTFLIEPEGQGPLHRELGERLEGLVRRFPHSARAYAARASYGAWVGRSELDWFRDMSRCAQLAADAKEGRSCATLFRDAAREYEVPTCGKGEVDPGFKVFAEKDGSPVKQLDGKRFSMAPAPFLDSADVDEVVPLKVTFTEPLADGGVQQRADTACKLKFNSAAQPRLAKTLNEMRDTGATNLDSNGWRPGRPIFWLGGSPWVLGDTAWRRFVSDGSLVLPPPPSGPGCMRICKRTHVRHLPADIVRPPP